MVMLDRALAAGSGCQLVKMLPFHVIVLPPVPSCWKRSVIGSVVVHRGRAIVMLPVSGAMSIRFPSVGSTVTVAAYGMP